MTADPGKAHETNKPPPTGRVRQPEESCKGQKETPPVRPLPRIPLASIHLG